MFDRAGDIKAGGRERGWHHQDTRFLSRLELRLGGVSPSTRRWKARKAPTC
jgi:hypothetical protein